MATRSKPRVKTPAKSKPKTRAKQQGAAKISDRDTLAKLRAHVDDIEKRLKRANSLTRTSVRALKTSYEALNGDNHTTALTGHIEELSERLTGMIEQTRQDVAHDLKIVLGDPRLETLSNALTKANQRLTLAEQNQAEAINAINTHIARLATAVDERMRREQRQREEGHALLSKRMDTIEQDSAAALRTIGDKMVNISEELTQKTQALQGEVAEKTLIQQRDYEEHKHQMAQRIEAIEDEQRNQFPAFERGIETLSTRLEALESNIGMYGQPVEPASAEPAYEIAPQISEHSGANHGEESHCENTKTDDAFAALELVDVQGVEAPASTPATAYGVAPVYTAEAQQFQPDAVPGTSQMSQAYTPVEYSANNGAMATAVAGHNPDTFSPRAYVPGAQEDQTAPPPPFAVVDNSQQDYTAQVSSEIATTQQIYAEQPAFDPVTYDSAATLPPPMPSSELNAGMPPMPPMPDAAVPEIQTLEPTMESVRPGADIGDRTKKSKKHKVKKPKSGGGGGHGTIRKVALFGGVAVVALFAYKTFVPRIFGSDGPTPQSTQSASARPVSSIQVSGDSEVGVNAKSNERPEEFTTTDGQNFETVEPVGDYSKTMTAPNLESKDNRGQLKTLEAAASAGNAIAQFQLGLSHLEAGRDADAVRLIRLAANQGQPAAQYRLAKLYEAGIGVKVNGKTAKELLTRAAKADNRIAMHDLGHYYITGADGSAPDLQQAVKWFSMAAERGVLDSQYNLAVLYQGGSGVPRSLEEAYIWFAIAGAQGDKTALQRSESVARELSEASLAKAQARIKVFAPKPVDNAANGVFKNLPWITEREARKVPTNKNSVRNVQKMLASLGYSVGAPDGTLGPNTRNAIIKFERANGLPETGRVNAALMERLQLAAGA